MSSANDPASDIEPRTVDAKGNAPANRITTADAAWKSYQEAIETARLDDARFSEIRGINDGFPPVDPRVLKAQGLDDVPNANLRQFSASVSKYVSAYVDHNVGGDKWAEIQLKKENFDTLDEWKKASAHVSDCFNRSLKFWEDTEQQDASHFIFERVICDTQMGLFGIGVQHFQDEIDWRPCAVPTRNVLPSRGTKVTLTNCQALFIKKPYTVAQLYNYVKDEKTAKETKWNRASVLSLLYTNTRNATSNSPGGIETLADWENRVRNNDLFLMHDFRLLELVDCYIQEFNTTRKKEGISHYVVHQWAANNGEFLYENDRQFKRWRQILIPFCDSTGPEGDWHGVKGLGDMIFDSCHLGNVLYNAAALAAMMSMMPMFQAATADDREKLNQIVFSRLCILFPGLEVAQIKLSTDINGALAVLSEGNRVRNANTQIFPQDSDGPRGEQRTATEATFNRQDQAQLTSLQIKFYRMTGSDPLLTEMYRRISRPSKDYPSSWPGGDTAKWFRDMCSDYGLQPKQYGEFEYVRAARSGGSGNQALDTYKAKEAMGVSTPGRGQMQARKEIIGSMLGWDRVEEFIEDVPNPIPEDALIELENTTLQNGQFISAYPFQMHERHLGEPSPEGKGHMGVLMVTMQAAQQIDAQGIETALQDAIKLDKIMENTLMHCAMHVQFLSQPIGANGKPLNEPIIKQLSKALNDISGFVKNFAKSIEHAVQEQQKKQQAQAPGDPEQQAEMMKAQAEIQRDDAKAMAQIKRDDIKHAAKLQSTQETAASRTALKEQAASVQVGLSAEQALIDQQRQKIEIQQKQQAAEQMAKTKAKKNTNRK